MNILKNIRILDFTRLLPGPLATNLLAQMGAEVIKVEHPQRGDLTRRQPPFASNGQSLLYFSLNHAKQIETIDFTTAQGRQQILDRIKNTDVVIEQFRPGVMADWKLGYENLKEINPGLIYISLSGYGQDGPYAGYAGHDVNYLAYAGLLGLTRDDQGRPVIPGAQVADIGAGSYLTMAACLGALFHRERTGLGSSVDLSMLDGLMPMMTIALSQHAGGIDPLSIPFLSGALVNYNVYQCADGKWLALGALEMKFWSAFCDLVGRPGWKRDNQLELSVYAFPKQEVEALFLSRTQSEWLKLSEGLDVCLSPVNTIADLENDPQLSYRKSLKQLSPDGDAPIPVFGLPFHFHTKAENL